METTKGLYRLHSYFIHCSEFITNKFNWLKSCKPNKDCPSPIVIRIWWTLTDFFSQRSKMVHMLMRERDLQRECINTPNYLIIFWPFRQVRIFFYNVDKSPLQNISRAHISTMNATHLRDSNKFLVKTIQWIHYRQWSNSWPAMCQIRFLRWEMVSHFQERGPKWEAWD